jgi:hypothetical protein
MANMTPEEIQEDRIVSAYINAKVALDDAAAAMAELLPQSPRTIGKLKKARADLDWYLSELEKADG